MYILAATGGVEDPLFESADSLYDLMNTTTYQNLKEFVRAKDGERVDILKVEDGKVEVIESFTD